MFRKFLISVVPALILNSGTLPASLVYADQPSGPRDNFETINIHTDRDLYVAGERLYFRIDLFSPGNGPVSGIAYLVLRNPGNTIIESISLRLKGNSGFGSVYLPDTLSSSAYQLVAFTNRMRNLGEGYYSGKQLVIVNRFDQVPDLTGISSIDNYAEGQAGPVSLKPLRKIYGTREKVQIEIIPSGDNGSFASLAVSVTQKQTLLDMQSGRRLGDPERTDRISPGRAISYYFKETDGPIVSGRVTHRSSNEGIPGATVILTTPDTVLNLLYAKTLADGAFHFRLNEYHEGRELFFSLPDKNISGLANIHIDDKFGLKIPFKPESYPGKALSAGFITTCQDIVRINKTLNIEHNRNIGTDRRGYRPEIYSSPSQSFALFTEYEYLNDMHEIARELIPLLRIRKQGEQYTSNLFLRYADTYSHESPAYFLDGIYTHDINQLIHLDSDNLKNLELQNYNWRHGDIVFPGIVALFSRKQAYRNLKLPASTVSVENHPITGGSLYSPPGYEKGDGNRSRPDFRQLLYWDPEIIVENSGGSKVIEFFSGDLKGEFIIKVMGYTGEGEFINLYSSVIIEGMAPVTETPEVMTTGNGEQTVNTNGVRAGSTEARLLDAVISGPGPPVDDPDKYFEQGLSGSIDLPSRRPIGNQHYPSEEWLRGDVILGNDIIVGNKFLKYNGLTDDLFWLYEGDYQQVRVDGKMVKEFRLFPSWRPEPLKFRRIQVYAPVLIGRDEVFGELLYEGTVSLYAYRRIIETTRGDYRIGDKLYGGVLIKPAHLYIFLLPDGTTRITRKIRRRNILDMFPEERREIRTLLRQNRMRPVDENDLIETARILNGYFLDK